MDEILHSISPAEQEKTNNRMLLAAKIDNGIKAKDWKKKDLMKALNMKNQSMVSKWLSGTHNFTTDTLTDIGRVLGINLLDLKQQVIKKAKYYNVVVSLPTKTSPYNSLLSSPDLISSPQQAGVFSNNVIYRS